MNFLKGLYTGWMGTFLGYATCNFLYEIYLEQTRYNMLLPVLSTELRTLASIQMMLMDLVLMITILCIILFICSLKYLEVF